MWKFYKWYDAIQEPYRMLVAILLASIGLVLLGRNGYWSVIGALYLSLLLLTRIYFVCVKRKE